MYNDLDSGTLCLGKIMSTTYGGWARIPRRPFEANEGCAEQGYNEGRIGMASRHRHVRVKTG